MRDTIIQRLSAFAACLLFFAGHSAFTAEDASSPISIHQTEGKNYASFTNALHPGNRIGYRFHEHTPIIAGEIPASADGAGIVAVAALQLEQDFAARPGIVLHRKEVTEEGWVPQCWTFYLAPVEDGIELLWVIDTQCAGLNEYYAVQQCFRMGGVTNETWRREIAETPAFSEFDLWNTLEKDIPRTSLAWVLRGGAWENLPATRDTVGARTPLGIAMDKVITGDRLDSMPEVGPYKARMQAPVDTGLVTRANLDKTWVCGLYWQHTTHVTDHHPADCLHAIVNIGPIPPHGKHALRGKIYWFRGTLEDLKTHWARDFAVKE